MGCLLQWTLLLPVFLCLPSQSTAQGKDSCTISGSAIQMTMYIVELDSFYLQHVQFSFSIFNIAVSVH